ncbi:Uncharacterised protein [Vibrio cholerae]|nr:Uncharacterised protein [Vibrio cholerae]CSI50379.1 Uncharacterised protein [Vibrio cholerae]
MIRANTSRPLSSVPNQFTESGAEGTLPVISKLMVS